MCCAGYKIHLSVSTSILNTLESMQLILNNLTSICFFEKNLMYKKSLHIFHMAFHDPSMNILLTAGDIFYTMDLGKISATFYCISNLVISTEHHVHDLTHYITTLK